MKFHMIHHISLNVTDLERAVTFYKKVLLLEQIERPPLLTNGAWFLIGSEQQLHLIEYPGESLRSGGIDGSDGHFALRVVDYGETISWLDQCEVPYDARPNSRTGFSQIYIIDPD